MAPSSRFCGEALIALKKREPESTSSSMDLSREERLASVPVNRYKSELKEACESVCELALHDAVVRGVLERAGSG